MTEEELMKYVDEYFEKYMCVSFDKFIENWEEQKQYLDYYLRLNANYKQALIYIREYVNNTDCCAWDNTAHEDILQIIDKALGGNDESI